MNAPATAELKAVVLVCPLKSSGTPSSSEKLGREVGDALSKHGVTYELIRVADENVRFGVSTDEGEGDEVLVMSTPSLAANTAHLARLLAAQPYPPAGQGN